MITALGKVKPGKTLYLPFHTFVSNQSNSISGLAVTDIEVYKNGGTTARASDNGYALLGTDGVDEYGVGIHGVSIDLSDNSDSGFYVCGASYFATINAITLDGKTVRFISREWEIGYEGAIIDTTIATLSTQTSFTLTIGPAEADALNGCTAIIHDIASAVQLSPVLITGYAVTTKGVTLEAGATFTAAAGDNISIFPPANSSKLVTVASDLVLTYSDTTAIHSDTAAIETDTGNIYSDTTHIHSDTIVIESEADAIHSELSDVKSAIVVVDTVVDNIYSDTTLLVPAVSDVESSLVIVKSDLVLATSDTTAIESELIQVHSETTVVQSDTVVIESDTTVIEAGLIIASGTIGATGNTTTTLHLDGLTYGNDEINDYLLVITDVSNSENHTRWIDDWADTGDLATVALLPFTPQASVDTYRLLSVRRSITATEISDIKSDTEAIESELIQVHSETTAVQSDAAVIESDTTAIESELIVVHSETTATQSDTTAIHSDTTALGTAVSDVKSELVVISDAVSDVESSLVIVKSDLVQVYSDTTHIDSDVVVIGSDLLQVYSDTTVIESDTTIIESDSVLWDTAEAEPAKGTPAANATPRQKASYVYKWQRNKFDVTASDISFYNDDESTVDHRVNHSDDGTTYTRGEISDGPP